MGLDWASWREITEGLCICGMVPMETGHVKGERKNVGFSGILVSAS